MEATLSYLITILELLGFVSCILCYHLQVVSSLLSYPLIVALVLLKHQEF